MLPCGFCAPGYPFSSIDSFQQDSFTKVMLTLSHLCFWEMCNCFLFEMVLRSQLEEMASQQGLLVQPLVLMMCHSAVLR